MGDDVFSHEIEYGFAHNGDYYGRHQCLQPCVACLLKLIMRGMIDLVLVLLAFLAEGSSRRDSRLGSSPGTSRRGV